jgi:hypothetical protein
MTFERLKKALLGGDLSKIKWMRLKPPYDASPHGILSLIADEYPSIKSAWVDGEPGKFAVRVKFKWWAWFIPTYRATKTITLTLRIKELCPLGIIFQGVSFT